MEYDVNLHVTTDIKDSKVQSYFTLIGKGHHHHFIGKGVPDQKFKHYVPNGKLG